MSSSSPETAAELLYVIEWLHNQGLTKSQAALLDEVEVHPKLKGVLTTRFISSPMPPMAPIVSIDEVTPSPGERHRDASESPLVVKMQTIAPTHATQSVENPLLHGATVTHSSMGEPPLHEQLRQMVEEVSGGVSRGKPKEPHGLVGPFPALPEHVWERGWDGDTWGPEDTELGYRPVVCTNAAEEARELWGLDDEGNPSEELVFPHGAGLSALQLIQLRRDPTAADPTSAPRLPSEVKFEFEQVPITQAPVSRSSPQQPAQLEVFDLKVIYEIGHTGFEENKDFPIVINSLIANRYQVMEYIGSAAFSRAVQCLDLKTGQTVCIKIIRNSKDFFDQSLDEIKLLQYLNTAGDSDDHCVLQLYDYFYYKEHLFLVCELLKDNLYEFSKYNREHPEEAFYFTMPRLQKITRSILQALNFIHKLQLMHCDLKPENILIKSYSRCEIKVIDFGSSCFVTDHLSSYIQSRCYRAPEVILGVPYDHRIDIWSLGCILTELLTGRVLFHNDSVPQMLARIASICGPYPTSMLSTARHAHKYFTRSGVVYERIPDRPMQYLYAKPTQLRDRLPPHTDPLFIDFVARCLTLNPSQRPTASALMQHPFLQQEMFSPDE